MAQMQKQNKPVYLLLVVLLLLLSIYNMMLSTVQCACGPGRKEAYGYYR